MTKKYGYYDRPAKLLKEISKSLDKGNRRNNALELAARFPNIRITKRGSKILLDVVPIDDWAKKSRK